MVDSAHSAHATPSITPIIDSGASSHIFPDREVFATYDQSSGNISGFSASSSTIVGHGTVKVSATLPKGGRSTIALCDACYAPSAVMSIISVSRLDECDDMYTLFGNGRSVTFRLDDQGALMDKTFGMQDVIFTGTKRADQLYYLDMLR